MSETGSIDAATRRLTLALDALEAAAERRREIDLGQSDLAAQVHALDDDRSRLASDLDSVVARSRSIETTNRELEITNREVARRLEAAIDTIRSVLESHDR